MKKLIFVQCFIFIYALQDAFRPLYSLLFILFPALLLLLCILMPIFSSFSSFLYIAAATLHFGSAECARSQSCVLEPLCGVLELFCVALNPLPCRMLELYFKLESYGFACIFP
jgi:hypothetical protein